jgi:hypothetical protein
MTTTGVRQTFQRLFPDVLKVIWFLEIQKYPTPTLFSSCVWGGGANNPRYMAPEETLVPELCSCAVPGEMGS